MTPDPKSNLPYEAEVWLRRSLAATAAEDGLHAPSHVEKALVTALRRRNRSLFAWRLGGAGSLAAAILAGLIFYRPPATAPPAPAIAVIPAPTVAVRPPAALQVASALPRPAKRPRTTRPGTPPKSAPAVASTAFIPVGPWQAMEPMERGSIIRVRLPKSSLPEFGIPVSADRWNETIPADVVLAEDGSMRAVRFVSAVQ